MVILVRPLVNVVGYLICFTWSSQTYSNLACMLPLLTKPLIGLYFLEYVMKGQVYTKLNSESSDIWYGDICFMTHLQSAETRTIYYKLMKWITIIKVQYQVPIILEILHFTYIIVRLVKYLISWEQDKCILQTKQNPTYYRIQ